MLYTIDEIDHAQLRIKKPIEIGTVLLFNIMRDNKQPVYIQSAAHMVAYRPLLDIYERMSICIKELTREFRALVEIERFLLDSIARSKHRGVLENKALIPVYRGDNQIIRLKGELVNMLIFDAEKRPTSSSYLRANQKIRFIAKVDSVWVSAKFYGLNLYIYQLQILEPLLNMSGFAFKESPATIEPAADVAVYQKMIKLGIPLGAVKQKMAMDGVDSAVVLAFGSPPSSTASPSLPPPPPPPPRPPPPSFNNNSKDSQMQKNHADVLDAIKNRNFNLKKIDADEIRSQNIRERLVKVTKDPRMFAPSLTDILKARGNLKKLH
jgi:hypothetical protein